MVYLNLKLWASVVVESYMYVVTHPGTQENEQITNKFQ